jgi:ABC-type sugar transport system ATPase subunit
VIQQYAPPQETYDRPANRFVAGFIGSPAMNFLAATTSKDQGSVILSGNGFRVSLPITRGDNDLPGRVILGVRPEDLDGPASETENVLTMMVSVKEQLGHSLLVYGDAGGAQIVASLDPHCQVELDSSIRLAVNTETLHVFDPDSMKTLI